jgi:hypothetical protein
MTIHHLKTWPEFFQPIEQNLKTFELRVNDRNFREGDILALEEYDPQKQRYTGRREIREVGYILEGGRFGLPDNMVIMSIFPTDNYYICTGCKQVFEKPAAEIDEINGYYFFFCGECSEGE